MSGEIKLEFDYQDKKIVRYFQNGFYYGDLNIANSKPCPYEIRTTTNSFFYTLSINKLDELTTKYPNVIERIKLNTIHKNKNTNVAMQLTLKRELESQNENYSEDKLKTLFDQLVFERADDLKKTRIKDNNKKFMQVVFENMENKIYSNIRANTVAKSAQRDSMGNVRKEISEIGQVIDRMNNELSKQLT